MVIGDRQTATIEHFSRGKRILQAVGSAVVRRLSGTVVPDAVSGFRAFSREAALQMSGVATFSYTIESLLQLGSRGLAVASVPVRTNRTTRPSRLFRSVPEFLVKSASILVRSYLMHQPLRVFSLLGAAVLAVGLIPIVRFLYFLLAEEGRGHVQSLVLGSALLSIGFMILVLGLLADLIACNRRLIELTLEKVRRLEVRDAAHRRSRAGKNPRTKLKGSQKYC